MIRLMNSAMLPVPGNYKAEKISKQLFVNALQAFDFISYIGYPDTADFISKIAGVPVPVSREQTTLENGDIMLVCKVAYRVNPSGKGVFKPADEDYEFWKIEYRG